MTEVEPYGGGGASNNPGGGKNGQAAPTLNVNRYATKKTIAQGMLDIALLTANASQLKYVLQAGKEKHPFYTLMLSLISVSIVLQITVGICFLIIGSLNINKPKSQRTADVLNNAITFQVFLITAVNVIISSFGIESSNYAEKRYLDGVKSENLKAERLMHGNHTSVFPISSASSLLSSGKVTFDENLLG